MFASVTLVGVFQTRSSQRLHQTHKKRSRRGGATHCPRVPFTKQRLPRNLKPFASNPSRVEGWSSGSLAPFPASAHRTRFHGSPTLPSTCCGKTRSHRPGRRREFSWRLRGRSDYRAVARFLGAFPPAQPSVPR